MKLKFRFSARSKIYFPVLFSILLSVVIITLYSVNKVRENALGSVRHNLVTQVQTIKQMFEREQDLKLSKVKNDLNVALNLFSTRDFRVLETTTPLMVENQLTGRMFQTTIRDWQLDGNFLLNDSVFVDKVHSLVGGTSTVFQKIDSGYVRISTNVRRSNGKRAVGTYIPNHSDVIRTVEKGETYYGRAYVVNEWYITAYQPVYEGDSIIGMVYVGDKEKDLAELRDKILDLKIGKSGFVFVFDDALNFIIHPWKPETNPIRENILQEMIASRSGVIRYLDENRKQDRIVAYDYFEDFRVVIAAAAAPKVETAGLVRDVVINSTIIGLVIILAFSIFVYFVTTENIRKFLSQLESSSKKLKSAEKALEQSERHFQTLFNNSSDDIFVFDFNGNFIEVNQVACETLGYDREEFLNMNVRDLKPLELKDKEVTNISRIRSFGQYRYESENKAKDGRIIPVETKSRVIDFRDQKVILSISRDISERKEVEDRILTTIIRTEENERKRFAADLHDDLAPILSTIKLYTDLLKKKNFKKIDEEEAIRNIEELVDMSITSTRTISRNIRPNILQDFGLAAAVNDFCSFIKKTESVQIEVVTHQYTSQKRGIEESVLYQAVKELINNTLKHASASRIKIELKSFENQVILYYRDNGSGFEPEQAMKQDSGLGLNNIVNKIKSVKGTVDINSRPGEGMFLIASLKLNPNETKT